MLPQEQITEVINDAKTKVVKKYGYKTWEDAYKLNGGNSFKEMIEEVMVEVYDYAKGIKMYRSDEKMNECGIGIKKHNESIFHLGQCHHCFSNKVL